MISTFDEKIKTTASAPAVTIVMPFRNCRTLLLPRVAEISAALADYEHEIIAVDDGSIDGGAALLAGQAGLRVVRLRRAFGQTAALAAGFDRAQGQAVVTIDVDGQTNPGDIPAMLTLLDGPYDLICGRRDRPRSLPTRIGNWLISRITSVRLHDYGCPLKAYRTSFLHEMKLYGDLYRFAPTLAFWQGARLIEHEVSERLVPRIGPGVGIRRIIGVLIDVITVAFITGYQTRPMQVIGRAAGALLVLAIGLVSYLGYLKFWLGQDIGNRSITMLAVLLIVLAVQLFLIGLLAEMAARVYFETQNRPIYSVAEELNAPING